MRCLLRVFTLGLGASAMALSFGSGCSDSDKDAGAYCDALVDRLRGCELISDGRFEGCVDYDDPAETCETDCLRDASCDGMADFFCGYAGSVAQCLDGCIGIAPFRCSSGVSLPGRKRCDGIADCEGGEDEADCALVSWYKCRNADARIPFDLYCDGTSNCPDGSDELEAECKSALTCSDGTVITTYGYCNGIRNCLDGEDEPDGCATSNCGL